MSPRPAWLARRVLLAPAAVRRAAARGAPAREAWMLGQPVAVRRSYVREVLDRGARDELEQACMLLQPDEVRRDFVRRVLEVD